LPKAIQETVVKPIAHSKMQNYLLWHKRKKVLQTIRKTKLPFKSDENTQEGISFGEKLSHAVQGVLIKDLIK
jgi:hypothetical protein